MEDNGTVVKGDAHCWRAWKGASSLQRRLGITSGCLSSSTRANDGREPVSEERRTVMLVDGNGVEARRESLGLCLSVARRRFRLAREMRGEAGGRFGLLKSYDKQVKQQEETGASIHYSLRHPRSRKKRYQSHSCSSLVYRESSPLLLSLTAASLAKQPPSLAAPFAR